MEHLAFIFGKMVRWQRITGGEHIKVSKDVIFIMTYAGNFRLISSYILNLWQVLHLPNNLTASGSLLDHKMPCVQQSLSSGKIFWSSVISVMGYLQHRPDCARHKHMTLFSKNSVKQ